MNSKFLGVSPLGSVFKAQLFRSGKLYYLGCYESEEEAARYYDRAAKLSEPWAKRRVQYNFPGVIVIAENTLTPQEKAMLEDLETRFPGQQESFKSNAVLAGALPEDVIQEGQALATRCSRLGEDLSKQLAAMQRAIMASHSKVKEMEGLVAHYKARAEQAENELMVLKVSRRDDSGKVTFRRVGAPTPLPDSNPIGDPIPGTAPQITC